MSSLRRSTRARTTKQSYVEVPESDGDTMGEELSSSEPQRASKRRRRVVIDTDDEFDEGSFPPSTSSAKPDCGSEEGEASASTRVVSVLKRQTTLWDYPIARVPKGEMPMGANLAVDANVPELRAPGTKADTDKASSEIPGLNATGIEAGEDSDEEDEFIPGPDPNVADEIGDEPDIHDVFSELEVTDAEVDEDFARKVRIILDLLCKRSKSISYADFREMPEKDRPVTYSTYRVLNQVNVGFLLSIYIPAIPLPVQELFSKREWCLDDLLSLPKVEENDAADEGLYANFPTGNLQKTLKIGCECYVGSTSQMRRRIDEHLKISRRYWVSTLPESCRRSFHYRTTCRENVTCNFRKLAVFKRRIPTGYLTILESIFMILFGSYNYPGYCSKWATESSYKMVEEIRARLDLAPIVWKGLNASLPLRQGTIARNSKNPSPCCNPACKTMTYPYSMKPDGPKHSRVLANPGDPLGGYLCRRCESYQERQGVLPDAATLAKLTSQYTLEVAKSDLRATGQAVVCSNCGAIEGADGAANSAQGGGTRHIASNGKVRCMPCDSYLRIYGKERDPFLEVKKAIRDQANADRAAGRPVRCKYCNAIEPVGQKKRKRWVVSKHGGLICRRCYDHLGRR